MLKKIDSQFEYKNGTIDVVGKEKLLEKIEIEQSNFQQLKKLPEAIILEEELVSRIIKILN